MKVYHRLYFIFSFNLSFFTKVYFPTFCPSFFLILYVFLQFRVHLSYLSFIAFTLLMYYVKLLIAKIHLFSEPIHELREFLDLIVFYTDLCLDLVNLQS